MNYLYSFHNSDLVGLTVPCFGVCGNGTEIYTRNCTPPIGGGMICTGPTQLEVPCDLDWPCPSKFNNI
jgi:hypothetical protein